MLLSQKIDHSLLNLAWSLWSELGVAGVTRKHQNVLILIEELVLFTAILAEIDPRLRDESIDWCSQYHHLISTSRLKSLMIDFEREPFSRYAASLNAVSRAKWTPASTTPLKKILLSHKSCLKPLESPALLNIRARSIFGTGTRADLITFFVTHTNSDFSISDVTEVGYTKRNLAEILEDLHRGGLFDKFLQGNKLRYRLMKNESLLSVLGPIPKYAPSWRLILKVLLSLRECIKRTENDSESTKIVEVRNCLDTLQGSLRKIRLTPPPFQNNLSLYWNALSEWLLKLTDNIAQGNLSGYQS